MTTAVNTNNTTNTGSSSSTNSAMQQLSGNMNTFLTLLTTQLQNQDPLSPMDSTQFTQQLVEYSQVEQQINTNTNLQSLISLQQAGAGAASVGYLGKEVTVTNGSAALTNGSATWNYSLASSAAATTLTVTNSSGQTVYSGSGATASGSNTFTWNGQDNNGNQMADGTYTLAVTATDANGNAVTTNVTSTGTVSEINLSGSSPQLMIGSLAVPLTAVSLIQNQTS
ncbi:MAG TPA: flagellar hook capping FlgD N-terminal domain-containing protein [Rhizomicrobium sp.]|nr:flagellar hook capping FlgD N-terminal domain-containing protein [Rhizomicrobium sp.]